MGATGCTDPPGHLNPSLSLSPPDFSPNVEWFLYHDLPICQRELRCIYLFMNEIRGGELITYVNSFF